MNVFLDGFVQRTRSPWEVFCANEKSLWKRGMARCLRGSTITAVHDVLGYSAFYVS